MSDINKSASCLSSWLRGKRYAVSDINKSASYLSDIYVRVQVFLVAGYAVRGTQ